MDPSTPTSADKPESEESFTDKFVRDANMIYKEVIDHFKEFKEYNEMTYDEQNDYLETLLRHFHEEHKEFARTFPIVLRYMVQLQRYSEKAFVRYVKRLKKHPYKTEEEYCRRQSEYIQYLHMELHPSSKKKENEKVRKDAYKLLLEELAAFKKAKKQADEKQQKNNKNNSIERRKELKDLLESL